MQNIQVTSETVEDQIDALIDFVPRAIIAAYTSAPHRKLADKRVRWFSSPLHLKGLEVDFVVMPTTACTRELFSAAMQQLGRRSPNWKLILCVE